MTTDRRKPETVGELEAKLQKLERLLVDAMNAIRCQEWMIGELQQRQERLESVQAPVAC